MTEPDVYNIVSKSSVHHDSIASNISSSSQIYTLAHVEDCVKGASIQSVGTVFSAGATAQPSQENSNDYWKNSAHIEDIAKNIPIISFAEEYNDPPGTIVSIGDRGGGGGGTIGTGAGSGGGNIGMGGGGGGAPATVEVHGVKARPDADGQLAIVDNQNQFIRSNDYKNYVGSHNYHVTVDETVADAKTVYSDIEDQQASDQQISDYLQKVAAGKSYNEIRSDVINSSDMKRAMDGYEQQLYGVNADQNTQSWLKDNLQNGRTIQDVRWEDAHSQRMASAIYGMINGVQDRTDACDAYDGNYKNTTMDALGRKETSFIQNRNNLINIDAENGRIESYENDLYGVAADQATRDWVKDNLHNGRTMQDVRWEDAHSQRMAGAIYGMINGVQDRTDACDAYDGNYKNATMDALGRKETSFIQNRNNLIDDRAELSRIKIYENKLYNVDPDQQTIDWVRSGLHSGLTMQDVRWIDAHSDRARNMVTNILKATGQSETLLNQKLDQLGRQTVTPKELYLDGINLAQVQRGQYTKITMLAKDFTTISGPTGLPIVFVAEYPPSFFASHGEADGRLLGYQGLFNFHTGGSWDIQRLGVPAGTIDPERRDYATVAIGIYAAAAGYSENDLLSQENAYAKEHSKFGNEPRSTAYPYLPQRNVANTLLGYKIYHEKNFIQ